MAWILEAMKIPDVSLLKTLTQGPEARALEKARSLSAEGKLDKAIAALEACLARSPESEPLLFELSRCMLSAKPQRRRRRMPEEDPPPHPRPDRRRPGVHRGSEDEGAGGGDLLRRRGRAPHPAGGLRPRPGCPGADLAGGAPRLPGPPAGQVGGRPEKRPRRPAHQDLAPLGLLRGPVPGADGRLRQGRPGLQEPHREEPRGDGEDLRPVRGHPGPGLPEPPPPVRPGGPAPAGRQDRRGPGPDGAGHGSRRHGGGPRSGVPAGGGPGEAAGRAGAALAARPGPPGRGKVPRDARLAAAPAHSGPPPRQGDPPPGRADAEDGRTPFPPAGPRRCLRGGGEAGPGGGSGPPGLGEDRRGEDGGGAGKGGRRLPRPRPDLPAPGRDGLQGRPRR